MRIVNEMSDDDDDEYVPIVPETSLYSFLLSSDIDTSVQNKIKPFSCYFCPKRKFKRLTAVHEHNQRRHKDVCKNYCFRQWKCLKCNSRLLSLNIRGLMAHVHENRCFRRKKSSRNKVASESVALTVQKSPAKQSRSCSTNNKAENQNEFLSNLGLIPSHLQREGQTPRSMKNRFGGTENPGGRLLPSNCGPPNTGTDEGNDRIEDLQKIAHVQANNEKTPLKFSQSANSNGIENPPKTPNRSSQTLYKTNTNVPRESEDERRDEIMRKKPKPINLDAEVFYGSFLSTSRQSASKAYEAICPKAFRRYKRQLRQAQKRSSKKAPEAAGVSTTVDENGRIVLRCESAYWSNVKNGEILK